MQTVTNKIAFRKNFSSKKMRKAQHFLEVMETSQRHETYLFAAIG